ncbi:MAG: complex I NDUFA9 subunit family protein [Gammaproteobacteria bacterium]|nr:complex I NDUFA9 subunit family protein [Gammaproteobacteria bacterium]
MTNASHNTSIFALSKKSKKICVIGGSGFVGTALINRLSREKHQVKVFTRRKERAKHLRMLPGVTICSVDYYAAKVLERQFDGYDIIINLAGILNPQGAISFKQVHLVLTQRLLEAASAVGITRFIHMSALNAGDKASDYLMSKGHGQEAVHKIAKMKVTTFCPSIIYGKNDQFFNRFATLIQLPGIMPLIGAKARFAPIYVEDVVSAIINSLGNHETYGNNYALCGPKVYTLHELVNYTAKMLEQQKTIFPMNWLLSGLFTRLLSILPIKPITVDNLRSMKLPSFSEHPIAKELGVTPVSIESVLPWYLGSNEKNLLNDRYRDIAQ